MKLSNFLEISEPFGKKKYRILFSTRTARKILISNDIYYHLLNGKLYKLSNNTLNNLYLEKILIDKEFNEVENFLNESIEYINKNDTLYEVIQPSANCQLGCLYCGQSHKSKSIDDNLIEEITNRIERKINNYNYKNLSIGWFGGEPLLAISKIEKLTENLKIISKNKKLPYSASITTNGLNLKRSTFKRLLNCNISEIEITLDGFMNSHDKRRPLKYSPSSSSYEIIIKNLCEITNTEEFKTNNIKLTIRSNIDKDNHKDIFNLVKDLKDKNLNEKIHSFYLAPIHSWGNNAHKNSLENKIFAKLEIDFMIYLLKNKFKIGVLPNSSKKQVCMSLSKNGEVYDAYGNIFNCTEIPYVNLYNKTDYYLSTLNYNSNNNGRSFSNWYKDIKDGLFPCLNCKILPICGGACPKAWYEGNPPCPSIKYNLKNRLLLFANQYFI